MTPFTATDIASIPGVALPKGDRSNVEDVVR